jgi:hypothetical protein
MPESPVPSPVANIRATVQSIEDVLLRPDLPLSGMEDLKSAIDDARLRLWAMISAAGSADPEGVLLRFRLRRGQEICQNVLRDLDAGTGTLGAHQRELLDLRGAASRMIERITATVRGWA